MDEATLIAKLRKIEALHAGARSDGERIAALNAHERIMQRLKELSLIEKPVEYKLSLHDPWARQVFLALARRYELRPFRRYRQHMSTVMIKVTPSFMNETLWPEFEAISDELDAYLKEVTQRVIAEAIHGDSSDAEEEPEQGRLE